MSAIAGYVDAVGFLASGGFFVSFMSGNSTRLAVGISRGTASAGIAAGLISGFVTGVVLGSLCGTLAGAHRRSVVLVLVSALLSGAAVCGMAGVQGVAIGLTALAMGAENAAFEQPGGSIGLTYMTGALAKVGQGIAGVLLGRSGFAWLSYLALWTGLVAGAILGAVEYPTFGIAALWLPASLSLLVAIVTLTLGGRGSAP
ncbi:YoaK family protein [Sphingomonas sp. PAMC 26605]|uniref:YoaK family protein n=1 Tax=Sphingomonas sp. PAMC 26605 TaxID=1112214 RepID=UPI002FC2A3DC